MEYEGETIVLAPPEYVIIRKLEYHHDGGSQKHLRDIRSMLEVIGAELNHEELKYWIKKMNLEAEWRLVSN